MSFVTFDNRNCCPVPQLSSFSSRVLVLETSENTVLIASRKQRILKAM